MRKRLLNFLIAIVIFYSLATTVLFNILMFVENAQVHIIYRGSLYTLIFHVVFSVYIIFCCYLLYNRRKSGYILLLINLLIIILSQGYFNNQFSSLKSMIHLNKMSLVNIFDFIYISYCILFIYYLLPSVRKLFLNSKKKNIRKAIFRNIIIIYSACLTILYLVYFKL